MLKRIVKWTILFSGILILVLIVLAVFIRYGTDVVPPVPSSYKSLAWKVKESSPGLFRIGPNWYRKSETGLYELYVEGTPFERGVVIGKLSKDLVTYQEEVFTRELHTFVHTGLYLEFIKTLVRWFNRKIPENVAEEFKMEIYGVSRSFDHTYDDIASPYQRILYYHAAHDVGHALQNVSLVGCTSFGTWGQASEDGSMIIGRNFDFYVGEDFGRNKIIAFYRPSQGHKFMMVTFGGMTGVLSGMNDQGLTVTLNSAKSEVPLSSATPVSLVAREILQYASTIAEAKAIAEKRKMFVAESFLIGSAKDGKAALIEKTPNAIDYYESGKDFIVSTNHFQGPVLGQTELNKEHMKNSASVYRYERVEELLAAQQKNSVLKTAKLLRNQQGLQNADIGMGNEKAVNQLIAHHSVIFQPEKLRVWVSTNPWQLGKYVCYDLNSIFSLDMKENHEIYEQQLTIPADSFLLSAKYPPYVKFSPYRFPFDTPPQMQPDSVVAWNPLSYQSYMIAGDYCYSHKQYGKARDFYDKGLRLEIATVSEKVHMEKNLKSCNDHLK